MFADCKTCASCGRDIEPRRKWRSTWTEIRYCSGTCRRQRLEKKDRLIEETILELLRSRAKGATVCPSEVARRIDPDDWRELMERTRCAARRLVALGELSILQDGRRIAPSRARGPIRLRLVERSQP